MDEWGHDWVCVRCRLPWDDAEHIKRLTRTGGIWRGRPSSLDPWAQWCRENLPNGGAGVVRCADDGILRSFRGGRHDDQGVWLKLEAKSRGKQASWADRMTLRCIRRGHALDPVLVSFDGDVPTHLLHWPVPCPRCGAPGLVPEPSTRVTTESFPRRGNSHKETMRPERLRPWLLAYMQHPLVEAAS